MPFEGINLAHSQYIPQYAGVPLEAMERVGDDLQTRHYDNIAKMNQLDLMAAQQAAATPSTADKEYINNQAKGIRTAIEELAKNGAENATGRIGAMATKFLGDEGLIRMKRNADQYRAQQEMEAKLGKSAVKNNRLTEEYLTKGTVNPDGTYRDFMNTAQERLDYVKKADQIFDPLRANTYQSDLVADATTTLGSMGLDKVLPGVSGDISKLPAKYKTQVVEKLSETKVLDFALKQGGWESYKSSSEYAQQVMQDIPEEEIFKEFISRGKAKIYEKIVKDWENNPMLGLLGKDTQTPAAGDATVQMANTPIKYDHGLNPDDFVFRDRKKTTYTSNRSGSTASGAPGSGMSTAKLEDYQGAASGIPAEKWQKFNETAKVAAEVFGVPGFDTLSEKSTKDQLNQASELVTQYQKFLENRVMYPNKDVTRYVRAQQEGRDLAKDETLDLIRNYSSAVFYDPTTDTVINPTKDGKISEELFEYLGEGGLSNMQITGDLNPKNHLAKSKKLPALADAYTVQVTDPKTGEAKELFVSRPIVKDKALSTLNRATNDAYSTFNLQPGTPQTVNMFGMEIRGKELMGAQLAEHLSNLPEEERRRIIAMKETLGEAFMPIKAEIPGLGEYLFNGPDHLAKFLQTYKQSK